MKNWILVIALIGPTYCSLSAQIRFSVGGGTGFGLANQPVGRVFDDQTSVISVDKIQLGACARVRADWKYGLGLESGFDWNRTEFEAVFIIPGLATILHTSSYQRVEVPLTLNWKPSVSKKGLVRPWIQYGVRGIYHLDVPVVQHNFSFPKFSPSTPVSFNGYREVVNTKLQIRQNFGLGLEMAIGERSRFGVLGRYIKLGSGPYDRIFPNVQYDYRVTGVGPNGEEIVYFHNLYAVSAQYLVLDLTWTYQLGKH